MVNSTVWTSLARLSGRRRQPISHGKAVARAGSRALPIRPARMFKFAFLIGIAIEWLLGPAVPDVIALAQASLRALTFMLLAWTILEACRLLVRAVMTLEDQPR